MIRLYKCDVDDAISIDTDESFQYISFSSPKRLKRVIGLYVKQIIIRKG